MHNRDGLQHLILSHLSSLMSKQQPYLQVYVRPCHFGKVLLELRPLPDKALRHVKPVCSCCAVFSGESEQGKRHTPRGGMDETDVRSTAAAQHDRVLESRQAGNCGIRCPAATAGLLCLGRAAYCRYRRCYNNRRNQQQSFTRWGSGQDTRYRRSMRARREIQPN